MPDDRVALVTGGAVRLGRGIVEMLAEGGWRVAFTYRGSVEAARELVDVQRRAGHGVVALQADLDDPDRRRELPGEVASRLGRLDAVVNNAASFDATPLATLDPTTFRAALATNLEAPLFLSLAAAPLLRTHHGAIVNISDIYAERPLRGHLAYCTSKAGLEAVTRSLALELAPEVRVNAVAPGVAIFPASYAPEQRDRILSRVPLARETGAAEIARAVRFLLEDAATITGQVITIDGGRTLAT